MVLRGRIELPTSSLPMTRSTTELPQHPERRIRPKSTIVQALLDPFRSLALDSRHGRRRQQRIKNAKRPKAAKNGLRRRLRPIWATQGTSTCAQDADADEQQVKDEGKWIQLLYRAAES